LAERLPKAGQRISGPALRALICDLCGWQPLGGDELTKLLGKDLKYLRNKHLSAMVQTGQLVFQYWSSAGRPQAKLATLACLSGGRIASDRLKRQPV